MFGEIAILCQVIQNTTTTRGVKMLDTIEILTNLGFEGFISFKRIRRDGLNSIPEMEGNYLVVSPRNFRSAFLKKSVGGYFKGKDPTMSMKKIKTKWVKDARVLYIGESGNLRTRIRTFSDFGLGNAVAHHGGRLIWQLDSAQDLLLCWKRSKQSKADKKKLLYFFSAVYGRLPFANLK